MPYIVKRYFKNGQVDCSPSVADPALAKAKAKRAWIEDSNLAEVTVEDELGKPLWEVFADGTHRRRS